MDIDMSSKENVHNVWLNENTNDIEVISFQVVDNPVSG
jgi:hypothetical protein